MGKLLALFLTLNLTTLVSAMAGEHHPASIKGDGIELFERNHAFAGSILETPVYGAFEHNPFGAKVQMRKGEATLELSFGDVMNTYMGLLVDGSVTTKVEFVRIEKTGDLTALITLFVDGVEVPVTVEGETFANGHFHAPLFTAKMPKKTLQFKFTGESCFGYSTNLAMMIVGAYSHLAKF